MDMGGMRAWLKEHEERAMIITRRYRTTVDEKETEVREFRLMMLQGDMDYTTLTLVKEEYALENENQARAAALERLHWETKRDTGVILDMDQCYQNGMQYMRERAKRA